MYLGSIPHGTESTTTGSAEVQAMMDGRIQSQAPILWQQVKDRNYENISKWHAPRPRISWQSLPRECEG
jgi:hypothetical protein